MIQLLDTAISLGADSGSKESTCSSTREEKERKVAKEKSSLEEKLLAGRKQVDNFAPHPHHH